MKLYAIETENYICIEAASSPEKARHQGVMKIGSANFYTVTVREATLDDIGWVKAIGGFVPEITTEDTNPS